MNEDSSCFEVREAVPPVIIVGMHRSGTTLVANLLHRLGLHLGWLLQENSESVFFVERNEALMRACGGRWDRPQPVKDLISRADAGDRALALLHRDICGPRFLSYLGPRRAWNCGRPDRWSFPWGWKDPRNSFLLPLWLKLFPRARVLHVYRHPMDVARSLLVREQRFLALQSGTLGGARRDKDPRRGVKDIRQESGMLWLHRRWRAVRSLGAPLRDYARLRVNAVAEPAGGLALWSAYVGECCRHVERISNPCLSVRYEEILADPVPHLEEIRVFCRLPGNIETVRRACENIRKERRYAYREDSGAVSTFAAFREDPWVRHLGYDEEDPA